jgi:hypothetical protein
MAAMSIRTIRRAIAATPETEPQTAAIPEIIFRLTSAEIDAIRPLVEGTVSCEKVARLATARKVPSRVATLSAIASRQAFPRA